MKSSTDILSENVANSYLRTKRRRRETQLLDNAYEECCLEQCTFGEIYEYQC